MFDWLKRAPKPKTQETVSAESLGECQLGASIFVQTATGYYLKLPVLSTTAEGMKNIKYIGILSNGMLFASTTED